MEGRDHIKDYFNEVLNDFEAEVRPDLWTNISSQVQAGSTGSAVGSKALSLTKLLLTVSAASVAVVGVVYYMNSSNVENHSNVKVYEKKEPTQAHTNESDENSVQSQNQQVIYESKVVSDEITLEPQESVIVDEEFIELPNEVVVQVVSSPSSTPVVKEEKSVDQTTISSNEKEFASPTTQGEPTEAKSTPYHIGALTNIFTPNGDGVNDYFAIETAGLADFSLVVIDQNNKTVFQTTDASFIWTGLSISGDLVAEGNYIYYLTARDPEGKLITKASKLTIKR